MKTIGLFNPSSPSYDPFDMERIQLFFAQKGFQVKTATNLFSYNRFLSGTDEQRAADIMELFADPTVDLMIALKGGYGSGRTLELLDYDFIAQHKKTVIGFSDTTALQLALLKKANLASWTGLSPRRDIAAQNIDPLIDTCLNLALKDGSMSFSLSPLNKATKDITGRLIGGTLSLIDELIGTPFLPDMHGAILFIEDVFEEPYKIDKMLTHLSLSGITHSVKGIILGDFYKCISSDKNDGTIEEVLLDFAIKESQTPIWSGLPYGHSNTRAILPIGNQAKLEKDTLSFQYKLSL